MQGRLRGEALTVEIQTSCAHCGRAIQLSVDNELHYQVQTGGADPLVFEPQLDWGTFTEPNIIHSY